MDLDLPPNPPVLQRQTAVELPSIPQTNATDYRLNTASNRYVKIGSIAYMRAHKAGTIQELPGETLPLYTDEIIEKRAQNSARNKKDKKNKSEINKLVAERVKLILTKKKVEVRPPRRKKYTLRKILDTDSEVYDSSSESESTSTT